MVLVAGLVAAFPLAWMNPNHVLVITDDATRGCHHLEAERGGRVEDESSEKRE